MENGKCRFDRASIFKSRNHQINEESGVWDCRITGGKWMLDAGGCLVQIVLDFAANDKFSQIAV